MSEALAPDSRPEGDFNVDLRGIHYDFLKDRLPAWFIQAIPQRQQELASHELQLPTWYLRTEPGVKNALAARHRRFRESLNRIETRLGAIEDIAAFAEPRLKAAIKQQFNLELDVRKVYLARKFRLKSRDDLYGFLVFDQSSDSSVNDYYLGLPLLETALANFVADEEQPPSCADCQIITTWGSYSDDVIPTFQVLSDHAVPVTPHAFARLCRSLDLGAQYQAHIKALVQPADVTQREALEQQLEQHHRDRLALSVEIAGLRGTADEVGAPQLQAISADVRTMLEHLLTGQYASLSGSPVTFAALKVFGTVLVGPLLIGPDRNNSDRIERLVVYLPNDPQQPLKEYASSAEFMVDLRARLHSVAYRRFFSRFVPAREQGTFFRQFNQLYQPAEAADSSSDYPLIARPPRLPMEALTITGNLWQQLRLAQVDKIFADARTVAVPTGDEDRAARIARLLSYTDAVIGVLNLAAFVVPGLGPLMMLIGAAQLCEEAFEGLDAYEQGETREMWAHFASVALNVAAVGTGAAVLPHVQLSGRVDALKPVTMDNGEQKLWRPDLQPYRAGVTLPADAIPDKLGLYTHAGQTLLVQGGESYQVRHDPVNYEYRIQHPTRPHAYAPRLEHNFEGAWQHELDQPLSWDESTLLRRLGQPAEGVSDQRLQQAREASGVEVGTLRAGHFHNDPIPLVLADTLQRFRIADELSTFIAQIDAADPALYAQADPALQMDLLQRRGLLSNTALRILDAAGNRLWDDPAPASVARRVVVVSEDAMTRGQLLQEVLYTLQGVDPALTEFPGQPGDSLAERAKRLRQYLGEQAKALNATLVEERYRRQTASVDQNVKKLLARYPTLPSRVASHLLYNLTPEQMQVFRSHARLPEVVVAQARWHAQEMRVSHAYEGLFVDALATPDTPRLALHTLQTLPGWGGDTRIELRQYSATGELLDAIGAPDAAVRKTVVLKDSGEFEGSSPSDVYAALWDQLSSAQTQALGARDAVDLQRMIQRAPLPREAMRKVLLEKPLRKPAYDPSMRLLGGGVGVRKMLARVFSTPAERAKKLFPTLSDAEVTTFLRSLGDNIPGRLSRLEAEYRILERDLNAWVQANAPQSDLTSFDRRGGFVRTYADEIKRCWRRETRSLRIAPGRSLNLPTLTADFSHVETLGLFNIPWTTGAQTFVSRFPQLKHLSIVGAALMELPEGLGAMGNLTHLSLSGNRIRMTPASVEQLGALIQLEQLDLEGNPLQLPPDFSAQHRLKRVNLSRTGLAQWPTGLLEQANLETLNLGHNELRTIPRELLDPAPESFEKIIAINHTINLRGNPLPAEIEMELDNYWQRVSLRHPGLMHLRDSDNFAIETPAITQVLRMFPRYTLGRARDYILRLGEGAPAELDRLYREFTVLKEQLDAWVFSGGAGAQQRYVRMGRVIENAAARDQRYVAQARILSCWRRETPQLTATDGTPIGLELDLSDLNLPALSGLDADFGHVGSLKLKNMNLSVSPEGFLARFRGLRWLDMSNNQLRELPPALGDMNNLTRLFLSHNQIRLTPDTARLLSERTTLRALLIDHNPLGMAPDFTRIEDIRSLNLSNIGIDSWPTGLGYQPSLDAINLDNNRLTTLPDHVIAPPDDQLANSLPLRCRINLANNPLTEATMQRITDYRARMERANLVRGDVTAMVTSARQVRGPIAARVGGRDFMRWAVGMTQDQTAPRQAQWLSLREQPGSDGFFSMLNDMQTAEGRHADLQRRVWEVIDSITEHSAESEALREEMFTWAGCRTCSDRAALSFSNVEIMKMVYRAKASATDASQGPALFKLARGLFRLDELEKIALADIARRTAEINQNPQLAAEAKRALIARLEEVEISLAYRHGLKGPNDLDLPGQPDLVRFTGMADVTAKQLSDARKDILDLNDSPEELKSLLSREFWKDYVANKHRAQFEALSAPYHERLATLLERSDTEQISSAEYLAQANDLQAQLATAEAALIESLTRAELAANPLPVVPGPVKTTDEVEQTDL